MRRTLVITLLLLVLISGSAHTDTVRLKCIADTNVSSFPAEQNLNYGKSSRIRLKGIEMLGLFQFDTMPVAGWKVRSAELFLRYANADRNLRTIGLSTVSAPWAEGTGSAEAKPGEATFLANGPNRWSGTDTDITDVTFSAGNTLAAYANIRNHENGWFSVEVEPRLIQAMIAGASYGMAVTDEKGQTRANNDVYSREQNGSEPYLIVNGEVTTSRPSAAADAILAPDPRHADFDTGAARITITPGVGTFSYNVRVRCGSGEWKSVDRARIPIATPGHPQEIVLSGLPPDPKAPVSVEIVPVGESGAVGKPVLVSGAASAGKFRPTPRRGPPREPQQLRGPGNAVLTVSAYPDTEKVNPQSGNVLEAVGDASYARGTVTSPDYYNPVWDGATIRLYGARNEVLGFQIVVQQVAPGGFLKGINISHDRITRPGENSVEPTITMYRDWHVNSGAWFPEACIPLTGSFDIPAADNKVPGQRNQSIFVDLEVPADAAPGEYHGSFTVSAPGAPDVKVPVVLLVNSLKLPDRLSFDISLNTYGTLGHLFGVSDSTEEYRAIERGYHRMAYAHRSTLAPLGYSHTGNISTNYAPPVEGVGKAMHVVDWSQWDVQFGPYLDGSAFAGLSRNQTPISHLYLPFHEAWPVDIRKHYNYNQTVTEYPAMIAEHALTAEPIETAVDQELKDGFTAIAAEYSAHFKEKRWNQTQFQFYQNDKYYYKDPKMGGRGTSWWLLDEPNHRDDWLALAFFNRLFQAGVGMPSAVRFAMREDVSRPQWQRDYLNGLVDVMCVSGELFTKGPRLREMREKLGVRYWNYGTANSVNRSNCEAEAWAIRAWLSGADAIVPWQSIGEDKNFESPEDTALLLPGTRFGIRGPIASLRLKALRRAQQDVEYLVLLSKQREWDREQVGAAIRNLLPLKADVKKADEADAGSYQFGPLHAADFASMRRAIGPR